MVSEDKSNNTKEIAEEMRYFYTMVLNKKEQEFLKIEKEYSR